MNGNLPSAGCLLARFFNSWLCLGITQTGHANGTLPFTASVPFAQEIELVTLRNSEESNRHKDELRREY